MTRLIEPAQLGRIGDMEIRLSVELGSRTLSIAELLALGSESVITLDTAVNAPLDVYVNGVLFGRGEVVELDEKFGLQLTSLAAT